MSLTRIIVFLKQFDFISQKPSLLINNSDRIRSLCGAFFTIAVAILIIIFGWILLFELIFRTSPKILKTQMFEEGLIDFDFPISFKINHHDQDKNYDEFFLIDVNMKTYHKDNAFHLTPLEFQPCEELELISFLCLKRKENILLSNSVSLHGTKDEIIFSMKFSLDESFSKNMSN